MAAMAELRGRPEIEGFSFVALLKACAKYKDLSRGTKIHGNLLRRGLLGTCWDALVTMYARCGALAKAKELFDMYNSRDLLTWTALIAGFVEKGRGQDALDCFEWMQQEGLSPDAVTFGCILRACGSIGEANEGEKLHNEIVKLGLLEINVVLGNSLVDMYVKCGALRKARRVLRQLPVQNVVSWNTLIAGYAQHCEGIQALNCLEQMQDEGLSPDAVTYISLLKACGSIRSADKGAKFHDEITKQGLLRNNVVLGTAVVDMYVKCGALALARQVLEELPCRNAVSWNSLIIGYAQQGEGAQALESFEHMKSEGLSPNAVTFIGILKACSNLRALETGKTIHDEIAKQGLIKDNALLGNALIEMYAKCGAFANARQVLEELHIHDVISWSTLIIGFAQHGEGEQALSCYEQMRREDLSPDVVTLMCILKSCGTIGAADEGEKIHEDITKLGLLGNDVVLGTALVDMYAKCGALSRAREALEEFLVRSVAMWNALIAGYAQNAESEQALSSYEQMLLEGLSPDLVTFTCALKACGSIGAAKEGERVHHDVAKQGLLGSNGMLATAVVDMYAKCGALAKARRVIEELPRRDVVSWNALIAGYAQESEGAQALACLKEMEQEGVSPDATTFSSMLSACSGSCLVEDAQALFINMSTRYGVEPELEHYACMVDLLGRTGHLDKAVTVIEKMPSSTREVWSALLAACQKWGDVNVARWAFEHGVQVDKSDSGFYTLMADIYAGAGMHEDAEYIQAMRIQNQALHMPVESG